MINILRKLWTPKSETPSSEEPVNIVKDYKFSNIRKLKRLITSHYILRIATLTALGLMYCDFPILTGLDRSTGRLRFKNNVMPDSENELWLSYIDHSRPIAVEKIEQEEGEPDLGVLSVRIPTDGLGVIRLLLVEHERAFCASEDKFLAYANKAYEDNSLMREAFGPF